MYFQRNWKLVFLKEILSQLLLLLLIFFSQDLKSKKVGKDISKVISNNLERSGLFIIIDKNSFIQDVESLNKQPSLCAFSDKFSFLTTYNAAIAT